MTAPTPQPPPHRTADAPPHALAERLAESVIDEFDRELRSGKPPRRRPMAKKYVWGAQPLWVLGIGLVLSAGLLVRGDDRWLILAVGVLLLAMDVGLWRPTEGKRGLIEVVLSGALALTAIARLAESIDRTFTVNHVYLILALVGAVFLLVEGFKRGGPEAER
ncbi:MAG: hypothetical protein ABIO65_10835 [Nitrospiria bacterium]